MGLYEQLPYTNFHEMNLDWLISDWKKLRHEFSTISEAFEDLKQFVDNYFDDLDVQEEINQKLDQMLNDGALTDTLMQAIAIYEGQFQQELNELSSRIDNIAHLTPGSTTGDAELIDARTGWKGKVYSSAGAAIRGQAEEAERSLRLVAGVNELDGYAILALNTDGVIITWPSASKAVASGVTTAAITYNIFDDSGAFPGSIVPGDIITLGWECNNANLYGEVYYYENGAWQFLTGNIISTRQFMIPTTATGLLLRLRAAINKNIGGVLNYTISRGARMRDLYNGAFPVIAQNSPSIDERNIIMQALETYKHVILLPGTHYSSGVSMPAGSTLEGCGESTIVHTANPGQHGIVISNPDCTVKNLAVVDTTGFTGTPGTFAGVYVLGDGGTTWLHSTRIENVTASGFDKAGIAIEGLGYEPTNGATVIGCRSYGNHAGLWLDNNAEYCRIDASIFTSNYRGVYCSSGNNKFINCDMSSNTKIGLDLQGTGHNDGHGSCVGCTFNHNGNNTGFGVRAQNLVNGYAFSGCQFWYNSLYMSDNAWALVDGCLFGGTTSAHTSIWTGALLFISDCVFASTPDVRGGASAYKMSGCYQKDGTAVTP